jgi:hypothetical protein
MMQGGPSRGLDGTGWAFYLFEKNERWGEGCVMRDQDKMWNLRAVVWWKVNMAEQHQLLTRLTKTALIIAAVLSIHRTWCQFQLANHRPQHTTSSDVTPGSTKAWLLDYWHETSVPPENIPRLDRRFLIQMERRGGQGPRWVIGSPHLCGTRNEALISCEFLAGCRSLSTIEVLVIVLCCCLLIRDSHWNLGACRSFLQEELLLFFFNTIPLVGDRNYRPVRIIFELQRS